MLLCKFLLRNTRFELSPPAKHFCGVTSKDVGFSGLRGTKARRTDTEEINHLDQMIEKNGTAGAFAPAPTPSRPHDTYYHRSRLGSNEQARSALLDWFDANSDKREMPWRKPWLDPAAFEATDQFEAALNQRAYQVWVSEIMLQQTRVSTVIAYFNDWVAKWPTVQDLAKASHEDVLAAWKGLGYYSRATRLHEAAQQIVHDMNGQIPADVGRLLKIKGIGKYTAGAISSIAFGRAVPLLDGNVARVLSRQLALHAKVKDRKVDERLWEVAKHAVSAAAGQSSDTDTSSIPGRWNQAMMELGSTVCTPKPKCAECPIQATCNAFAEGTSRAGGLNTSTLPKLERESESGCALCEPMLMTDIEEAVCEVVEEASEKPIKGSRKRAGTQTLLPTRPAKSAKANNQGGPKQRTLTGFVTIKSNPATEQEAAVSKEKEPVVPEEDASIIDIIAYCSLFPKREVKKQIPEEECLICIISRKSGPPNNVLQFLVEQRPAKGLLASLWEFPTYTLPRDKASDVTSREQDAKNFVVKLCKGFDDVLLKSTPTQPIPHVFSHLKLKMWVYVFHVECSDQEAKSLITRSGPRRLWVDDANVEDCTMGTGMKRCWTSVNAQVTS